jgi:ribonucleoside-diphosphate reductase alpha chain
MLTVIARHRAAVSKVNPALVPERLTHAVRRVWDEAYEMGERWGYRNSQVTVIAPTGTIAFMMDCDTTGIEPDIALIKYKRLVGGGVLKIVNQSVAEALEYLGYGETQRRDILEHLEKNETIEGAPHISDEHLAVFDCAFKPRNGQRSIHHMGHVRMMAAAQPFLSGAISKTVNMPRESTVDEIEHVYHEAWKLGLKAIAIYRDGCKRTQPLSTSMNDESGRKGVSPPPAKPIRHRLPDERQAITHKFSIAGHEGYVTVGLYPDGLPGEIFIVMAKEGSVVSGLVDSFATAVSIALQYGVPLKVLVDKFVHTRFEPSGITQNPQIRIAKSITDYIFRWLALKFLPEHEAVHQDARNGTGPVAAPASAGGPDSAPSGGGEGKVARQAVAPASSEIRSGEPAAFEMQTDAVPCPVCGSLMVVAGACHRCLNCGTSSGCAG